MNMRVQEFLQYFTSKQAQLKKAMEGVNQLIEEVSWEASRFQSEMDDY